MAGKTFVEKILGAKAGTIVFVEPDIVLTHDNTASIAKTFEKMGGTIPKNPEQLLFVLDHNAPPTNSKLANQYQTVRDLSKKFQVKKFHDAGQGICHQMMSNYAHPGMIIVGSDSHTCTAGAFNALAAGIDRTEAAGLWKKGETWFRVPETLKITLTGKLPKGVYAKDVSLWIIGLIGAAGANYMSVEYHGSGLSELSVSDRMTIANLASEMGAKNAVFPPDEVLARFYGKDNINGVWADEDAKYAKQLTINLNDIFPLTAKPHKVDNVAAVDEVAGTKIDQGLIGTCTNGRIEDIRIAAQILKGKSTAPGFQLLIAPASSEIYLQAVDEGLITDLVNAGAVILSSSCGPCLGTGQGIPADGHKVISTANRNFLGRMGNPNAEIFLASPATVAQSAITGVITPPEGTAANNIFNRDTLSELAVTVASDDNRYSDGIWDYSDIDSLNTDQMFAGNLTYNILSSDPEAIVPHLFAGFDSSFAEKAQKDDIIFAGENFGCGSSREHPAVGLAYIGIKAVVCKSVNRIFYRSAVNQGLPIIILPKAVEAYKKGDNVSIDFDKGILYINENEYIFAALPEQLIEIFKAKGLINYLKSSL